tara:strand:- start:841 stop:1386 length:546 start_codon:yes stop_codon:yes gene_type:complete
MSDSPEPSAEEQRLAELRAMGRIPAWMRDLARKAEVKEARKPVKYSEALFARICEAISGGLSVSFVLDHDGMPNPDTFYGWLRDREGCAEKYARARESQADALADEIVFIADSEKDAARARVRTDARKWVASKLKPRVYGDKMSLDADVSVRNADPDALRAELGSLLGLAVSAAAKAKEGE